MDAWWQKLSERERRMVVYGGIITALFLFYFAFWSPLADSIAAQQQTNAETRELITWMQKAQGELRQLGKQDKAPISKISLLAAIEQSVKRNHLETPAPEIKQLDQTRVQVNFATVEFISVVRWLVDVQNSTSSKIEKVTMNRTPKNGIVRTEVTLAR
ncbi:MAG: type II secretion system protein M [Pseudomonadota bacterium]|nr:type II secretion system protein M [Pseudomonadota bacterium]